MFCGVGNSSRMLVVPWPSFKSSYLSSWNRHLIFLNKLFWTGKCELWLLRYKKIHSSILLRILFSKGWDNGHHIWKSEFLLLQFFSLVLGALNTQKLSQISWQLGCLENLFFFFFFLPFEYNGICPISKLTRLFPVNIFSINARGLLWIIIGVSLHESNRFCDAKHLCMKTSNLSEYQEQLKLVFDIKI